MEYESSCPLAIELAGRIMDERRELTARWLEHSAARVSIDRTLVFPSEEPRNHVLVLIEAIGDYVGDPTKEISASARVGEGHGAGHAAIPARAGRACA